MIGNISYHCQSKKTEFKINNKMITHI